MVRLPMEYWIGGKIYEGFKFRHMVATNFFCSSKFLIYVNQVSRLIPNFIPTETISWTDEKSA